ncbi:MAG: helix-turn-helix domain-containing protein [Halieaceae bacterium]|nr:helix-turn-helix domain-containing protein [Halieaceae bacterium]
MPDSSSVIASGNLAGARRIIAGVLGQLGFLGVDDETARRIFTNAGLPVRALEEPDFPISLQQELEICAALVNRLPEDVSPIRLLFEARPWMGIENLGVIGMAMKHAANAVEALKVCLAYPELTMGHCRMVVRQQGELSLFAFQMDRPSLRDADEAAIDRLVEYCTVLDLSTSLRNIEDIAISGQPPTWVSLPFPEPADWQAVAPSLEFPVRFSAAEACIAYPQAFDDEPLPNANPLLFKMYASLAEKMAQMLGEDAGIEERVMRWLWAYTPPLSRSEVADLLAMSERNLTRQLSNAGTSYSELLARVQSERARNFLRNPELSVTEIGYRLGYSEPAAFSRAFTHWTGESPLRWRQARQ